MFINLLTTFFVFKTAENWFSRTLAWWASGVFLLLSFGFHAQGCIANCEQFVNVFLAAGLVFLTKKWTNAHLFLCGLMFGLATLMKQHAFHFGLFPAFLLLKEFLHNRNFAKSFLSALSLAIGYFLPLAGTVAFFWHKGIFDPFYFYIIDYAIAYSKLHARVFENVENIGSVMFDNTILWLALIFTVFIILKKNFTTLLSKRNKIKNEFFEGVKNEYTEGANLCVLLGISFASVCPGWYFRPHYLHFMFIPAALMMAYTLTNYNVLLGAFAKKINRSWFIKLSFLALFIVQAEYIVLRSPEYVTSIMHRWCYFTEIRQVGDYLNQHVKKNEYLGQLGFEPELWFYTQTQAASGFLYAYPLIENHKYAPQMVEQFIAETEAHCPEWFIYSDVQDPDDAEFQGATVLNKWAKEYLKAYERQVILYRNDKLTARFEFGNRPIDTTQRVVLEVYKRK